MYVVAAAILWAGIICICFFSCSFLETRHVLYEAGVYLIRGTVVEMETAPCRSVDVHPLLIVVYSFQLLHVAMIISATTFR